MEEVKKQEMESLFCPYKQSLALKELRFEEPCMRGWDKNGKIWYHPDSDIVLDNPTFSQSFRFFREKYRLISYPVPCDFNKEDTKFDFTINGNMNYRHLSYEEAELACVRKLIEIVKKQK